MEQMLCGYFDGDTAVRACKLSRLAAILPAASMPAADCPAQQHLTCQDNQLIAPQMHSCVLLVAHSLMQPMSAPIVLDSNKGNGTCQPENLPDTIRRIFWTPMVVVKAAVVALGVQTQNADTLSARAQLWMSVHAAARRLQAYIVETTGAHADQQSLSVDDEAEAKLISTLLVQLILSALRLSHHRGPFCLESNGCRICCHVLHAKLAQRGTIACAAATEINKTGKGLATSCTIYKSKAQLIPCSYVFAACDLAVEHTNYQFTTWLLKLPRCKHLSS